MSKTTSEPKRQWAPKCKAVTFADKRTKRNKTRQAKLSKILKDYA